MHSACPIATLTCATVVPVSPTTADKRMLTDNFNDYITNFDKYTQPSSAPKG